MCHHKSSQRPNSRAIVPRAASIQTDCLLVANWCQERADKEVWPKRAELLPMVLGKREGIGKQWMQLNFLVWLCSVKHIFAHTHACSSGGKHIFLECRISLCSVPGINKHQLTCQLLWITFIKDPRKLLPVTVAGPVVWLHKLATYCSVLNI